MLDRVCDASNARIRVGGRVDFEFIVVVRPCAAYTQQATLDRILAVHKAEAWINGQRLTRTRHARPLTTDRAQRCKVLTVKRRQLGVGRHRRVRSLFRRSFGPSLRVPGLIAHW